MLDFTWNCVDSPSVGCLGKELGLSNNLTVDITEANLSWTIMVTQYCVQADLLVNEVLELLFYQYYLT